MKKSLLATTALAALGAVAVASPASAKFDVSVKGYMEQWFGYSDNSDSVNANADSFDQFSDSEFFIGFSQELDSGLKIGGEIQVEGQQGSNEAIDEQYIYMSGTFGRIELGTDNGAPYRMHYGVVSKGVGIDEGDVSAWIAGGNGRLRRTSQTTAIDNDANKITYFSPRINGFQVGASYMPDSGDVNTRNGGRPIDEADGNRDNGFGAAVNYKNSFDMLSVSASLGYMDAGNDNTVVGEQTALSGGIRLGFGGFTASLAYGEHEDDTAGRDENVFGVGIAYSAGPAGVSLAYIRGEDSDRNADQDAVEVGASYKMGPGVTAKGSLYYLKNETNGAAGANGVAVVGGLALSF
jgi:outer membrane protein OmpU